MQHPIASKESIETRAATEISQVGAAAQTDVLTMIDQFPRRWIAKAGRSSAQLSPGFKQLDVQILTRERDGRRQSSQSTANDRHARLRFCVRLCRGIAAHGAPAAGFAAHRGADVRASKAFPVIRNLCQVL